MEHHEVLFGLSQNLPQIFPWGSLTCFSAGSVWDDTNTVGATDFQVAQVSRGAWSYVSTSRASLQPAQQCLSSSCFSVLTAIPVPLSVTQLPHQLGCSFQNHVSVADLWSAFQEPSPLVQLEAVLASM